VKNEIVASCGVIAAAGLLLSGCSVKVETSAGVSKEASVSAEDLQQVEEVLMQKLSSDGTPVETVECVDDIASKVGSTVECVTVTGNDRQGYDVTVSEAEGDTVNFDYKAKP
jgi:hypothetical protein